MSTDVSTDVSSEMSALLPAQFADLEHLVAEWAIEDGHQRYLKRVNSSMVQLRSFYDQMFPRSKAAIDYIDQFPANTVEIYNRWGDRIFSSNGYEVPFDGTYKGKELPVGTYYFIININHPGYPKPITGPLTIFR